MTGPRLLLLKSGTTAAEVREKHGDYDAWFLETLAHLQAGWTIVRPYLGDALPDPHAFDAVLMTGSPASVTEEAPWMKETARWLRANVEGGMPYLGVCFGHQLLGYAFGARVVRNPRGREMGTVSVALNDAGAGDPLFAGEARQLVVQQTHEDIVDALPPGATLLASNEVTPVQAMALGPKARGVQFHPEMRDVPMADLVRARAALLEREGEKQGLPPGEAVRRVLESVRPSETGRAVLTNFVTRFAGRWG